MKRLIIIAVLIVGAAVSALAQVTGVIIDGRGEPLPFANAIIYKGESLVKGTVTDMDGSFSIANVKAGDYKLTLSMMGYETRQLNVTVNPKGKLSVGSVTLNEESLKVGEVSVVAQKQTMKLEIDKKVFDVSQDISSTGGSASDVLENIPSVEVDSEGNVSLRGSSSVTIWINGKAQGMTSDNRADILQQLPSESIDHIEVITNPSSKYSAEGSAGIINIVLKKDRKAGYYGGVQLNVNTIGGGRIGGNINYNSPKFDAYLNIGYGRRVRKNGGWSNRDLLATDGTPTGYLNSVSSGKHTGNHFFGRAGVAFHLSDNDEITLGYMGMFGNGGRKSSYEYISDNYEGFSLVNGFSRDRVSDSDNEMRMHSADLSYRHTWKTGHFIEASLNANRWNMDGDSFYDQSTRYAASDDGHASPDDYSSYQRQKNTIANKYYEAKVDYERPISDFANLEAGYNGGFSRENSPTETFSDEECAQSIKSLFNRFKYDLDVHALYANWKHKVTPVFGYQVGLRGEWWTVNTVSFSFDQEYNGQEPDRFKKSYSGIFPTGYLSFKLTETQELQLNYTRRLMRPWGGQMNSFKNISDSTNISYGNPLLTPEFSHSLELNYLKNWDDHTLSVSAYFRPSSDVIQQIAYLDPSTGVRYSTSENVANSLSSGLEIVGKNRLWKRLDLTSTVNVYYYKLDGGDFSMPTDDGTPVAITVNDDSDFSWNLREMASLMLPLDFTYQATFRYEAPTVITQGKKFSSHTLDMGLRKSFARRTLTAAVNCRDILDSRASHTETSGAGFNQESYNWFGGRRFIFQLAWNFGNMKAKPSKQVEAHQNGYDTGGGED